MFKRILTLLGIVILLTVAVVWLFQAAHRDYLTVRHYYLDLRSGRIEVSEVDMKAIEAIYAEIRDHISREEDFNVRLAAMVEEILWRAGRREDALEAARRLARARPRNIGLAEKYADRLSSMGQHEEADRVYRNILNFLREGQSQ